MNLKKYLTDWLIILFVWQIVCFLFVYIGVSFLLFVSSVVKMEPANPQNGLFLYINSVMPYVESGLFAFLFGTLFYAIHLATEHTIIRRLSFGRTIIIQSVLYLLAFLFVGIVLWFVFKMIFPIYLGYYQTYVKSLTDHTSLMIAFLAYFLLVIVLMNFFFGVRKKFGPGNLWSLFIGRYHNPIVVNKIFMFLDLKDSTAYAEKLGHIKYSRLIQSCFQDLNTIVSQHNAQIYQYVGDEVVLMWDKSDQDAAKNCLTFFYSFRELLHTKSQKYISKYGFLPEFKAGINDGVVTAAEVGNIKSEIAFHGDVLNTAARIQQMCNQYKKHLLASESFVDTMKGIHEFKKVLIGYIPLKGKSVPVNIYSIELV